MLRIPLDYKKQTESCGQRPPDNVRSVLTSIPSCFEQLNTRNEKYSIDEFNILEEDELTEEEIDVEDYSDSDLVDDEGEATVEYTLTSSESKGRTRCEISANYNVVDVIEPSNDISKNKANKECLNAKFNLNHQISDSISLFANAEVPIPILNNGTTVIEQISGQSRNSANFTLGTTLTNQNEVYGPNATPFGIQTQLTLSAYLKRDKDITNTESGRVKHQKREFGVAFSGSGELATDNSKLNTSLTLKNGFANERHVLGSKDASCFGSIEEFCGQVGYNKDFLVSDFGTHSFRNDYSFSKRNGVRSTHSEQNLSVGYGINGGVESGAARWETLLGVYFEKSLSQTPYLSVDSQHHGLQMKAYGEFELSDRTKLAADANIRFGNAKNYSYPRYKYLAESGVGVNVTVGLEHKLSDEYTAKTGFTVSHNYKDTHLLGYGLEFIQKLSEQWNTGVGCSLIFDLHDNKYITVPSVNCEYKF